MLDEEEPRSRTIVPDLCGFLCLTFIILGQFAFSFLMYSCVFYYTECIYQGNHT